MNILFPLAELAFSVPFNKMICVKGNDDPELPVQLGNELAQLGTGFFQVVSGLYLVGAVKTIYGFFKKNEKKSFIDIHFMVLHAGSFTLYLFFSMFYYISLAFYLFNPTSPTALQYYTWAALVYTVGSFISQVLLCAIFQDLSVRHENLPKPPPRRQKPQAKIIKMDNKVIKEISEEDNAMCESYQMTIATTEDAHLQSRIWNRFVKGRTLTESERAEVTISAESLTVSMKLATKIVSQPKKILPEPSAITVNNESGISSEESADSLIKSYRL